MPKRDAPLPVLARAIDALSRERFASALGRRIALLGSEDGSFECWMWPIKLCHELELSFRLPSGASIAARTLARRVEVDPFELRLEYEHAEFRARLSAFAALDRRALTLLVEIECAAPLSLELGFAPDFRPMWPAGLGGQIARRDPVTGAVLLTEELGRYAALLGSPEAEPPAADADHGLPREPVRVAIPVTPARAARGPIPFFVAGAELAPPPLSDAARLGDEGAALGLARAGDVVELARAEYRRVAASWSDDRAAHARHWRGFLARTTELASGDAAHDAAFLWSKIAIERAWVEVDGLGRGLVAGLAPAGAGERPGFGWFFDGDALVASRSMSVCGDFEGARAVLEFAASHQRADGKLMHELVLSARLCDWIGDYPYAYYKGVNTPDFLGALFTYVEASDDVELLERLWPAACRAFAHARACVAEDGLYSVRKAGLAAVEAGPLVGRIESEVFAHGLWIEAATATGALARRLGDPATARAAEEAGRTAVRALARFWDSERGRFAFARLVDGTLWPDVTGYHGQALAWTPSDSDEEALAEESGLEERVDATLALLNHPDLASDWGVRMFPRSSAVYDPEHYNTGSVFPYLNQFAIRALSTRGDWRGAHQLLRAQVQLCGFAQLGCVPEHLHGDRAVHPRRGVPHQIFSSATIPLATIDGLAGARWHQGVLALAPQLPLGVDRLELRRVPCGASTVDATIARTRERGRTRLEITLVLRSGPPIDAGFTPFWPLPTRFLGARCGGERWRSDDDAGEEFEPLQESTFELRERLTFVEEAFAGPDLGVDPPPLERGAESRGLRVGPARRAPDGPDALTWTLWGRAGESYRCRWHSDVACTVEGARVVAPDALEVRIAAGDAGAWVAHEVCARIED